MVNSLDSINGVNLKKIALFWIGVIFLLFALVVNIFLIIMEIYPDAIIGIIIGLYTTSIGVLSLFYAIRWDHYEPTDAITKIDKILYWLGLIIFFIGVVLIFLPSVLQFGAGVISLIISAGFIIGWTYVERYNTHSSVVVFIIIGIMVICFGIGMYIISMGFGKPADIVMIILPFGNGILYAVIQLSQSPSVISPQPSTSASKSTDDINKRGFQLTLLFGLFFVCAILIMCGVWQIFLAFSPELILLGYVLVSIGLIALIATVALTSFIILCNIASNNDADRTRLKWLLLGIAIGIFSGILVGYLLFAYVIIA